MATLAILAGGAAQAQGDPKKAAAEAERRKTDIAQHRRLAEVHELAAKCLEGGRSEKECHDLLARECKGVGIGRHCGLRHTH